MRTMRGRVLRAVSGSMIVLSLGVAQAGPALAQYDATATPAVWSQGTGSTLVGKTNVERAIGKCVASVIGGAILGALVGAAAGSAKKGALIGTAVGAGACAVMMKIASKKDKMALREAQLQAANAGYARDAAWVNDEGSRLSAVVTPSAAVPLVVGTNGSYRCRTDNRCLVGDAWVPYETLAAANADGGVQKVAYQPKVYKCRRLDTRVTVNGDDASPDSEAVCLVGDTWVTGDKLKKLKIRDADVVTI